MEWIDNKRASLIYSATRDGFGAAAFHRQCDNKGKTLTVIQSNGYLFGGYTDQSWDGSTYKNGASWLFTLTSAFNIAPTKYPHAKNNSVYCYPVYGPTFGNGHDITVSDNSNTNSNSYTHFPHSFSDTTGKGNVTFAGTYNFQTTEIEVFLIQ